MTTPILIFPHRGGRDLFSPPKRGRVRVGVGHMYQFQLVAALIWFGKHRHDLIPQSSRAFHYLLGI